MFAQYFFYWILLERWDSREQNYLWQRDYNELELQKSNIIYLEIWEPYYFSTLKVFGVTYGSYLILLYFNVAV